MHCQKKKKKERRKEVKLNVQVLLARQTWAGADADLKGLKIAIQCLDKRPDEDADVAPRDVVSFAELVVVCCLLGCD